MSHAVSPKRAAKPRWQRRKAARPAEIVAAALQVFVERGFAATKLYDEVISRGHRLLASALERGIKSGEFRPVDVISAVRLAIAPVLHAANWRHSFALCTREGFDVPKYLDNHVDIFLRGIAKHPDRIN